MTLPIPTSYPPMEALLVDSIPAGADWLYEPKWDGFRCLAFRDGDSIAMQSHGTNSKGRSQAEKPLELLRKNPFQQPHRFEKLVGDLEGSNSRRINIHYRLVYQILEDDRAVKVLRIWTHYG